jgi:pilus assembly protein Flp/PilA
MNTSIRKFLAEEDGITALEYGLLAAIVAAAIFAVFSTHFESLLQQLFNKVKTAAGIS